MGTIHSISQKSQSGAQGDDKQTYSRTYVEQTPRIRWPRERSDIKNNNHQAKQDRGNRPPKAKITMSLQSHRKEYKSGAYEQIPWFVALCLPSAIIRKRENTKMMERIGQDMAKMYVPVWLKGTVIATT